MTTPNRLPQIDALRGVAVAQMVVFHACYDLAYFGWLDTNFRTDTIWLVWRTLIISMFLLVCGFSITLRSGSGVTLLTSWSGFWKRWCQIAAAAVCVTAGSALMFPNSFIYFGVLHFVCAALIIGVLLRRFRRWNLLLAAVVLLLHWTVYLEAMNPKWINWVGLVSIKPFTEDYVPLIPWLAPVLIGIVAGDWWQQAAIQRPQLQTALLQLPAPRWLVLAGVWSLTVYLVHQPIMIGVMMLIKQMM